jgi:hypothetical protein
MAKLTKIQLIQGILGVDADDKWGSESQAALDALTQPKVVEIHHQGKASSFADPKDIDAFKRAKALGMTDNEAFAHGDNGIGVWMDDTTHGFWCALPIRDLVERWGSKDAGKHKKVTVTINNQTHILTVGDVMTPNLSSGAIIDLSPDSCALFHLKPPVLVPVEWQWA